MLRCDSISLEWQPARRREMRIHWILTATEQGVANGGDHLSELFLRAILFKCCFCCGSNIIHQTSLSNRCSLMSAKVGVNTNKLIIHVPITLEVLQYQLVVVTSLCILQGPCQVRIWQSGPMSDIRWCTYRRRKMLTIHWCPQNANFGGQYRLSPPSSASNLPAHHLSGLVSFAIKHNWPDTIVRLTPRIFTHWTFEYN